MFDIIFTFILVTILLLVGIFFVPFYIAKEVWIMITGKDEQWHEANLKLAESELKKCKILIEQIEDTQRHNEQLIHKRINDNDHDSRLLDYSRN